MLLGSTPVQAGVLPSNIGQVLKNIKKESPKPSKIAANSLKNMEMGEGKGSKR